MVLVESVDELVEPPSRFTVQGLDPKYAKKAVQPYVSVALNEIPSVYNPTITSLTRLPGHSVGTGEHDLGKSVDFKDDQEGLKFFQWAVDTDEGKKWKDKYGVKILYHGNKGAEGAHYHFRFEGPQGLKTSTSSQSNQKYQDYEKHTKELLENKGYSKAAIAGIMGNIAVETGGSFDYTQKQKDGNGYGLFQFDFMKSHYYNYLEKNKIRDSAEAQIAFMDDVINGRVAMMSESQRKKLKEVIDSSEDPEEIARVFMEIFENPGVPHLDKRTKQAKDYYGKYFTS
jgi:hypothetical protein